MPLVLPHTFADGPGNTASGVQVMNDLNAINAGVAMATVTTLPASPVNGQDAYYLADATNGIVWHFKYRAASASSFKWEFVGGQPLYAEVATQEGTSSTSFVGLTTAGPSITAPLAGDYMVRIGAKVTPGAAAGSNAIMSYDIGGGAASDADGIEAGSTVTGGDRVRATPSRSKRKTGLSAATVLLARYRVSVAASATWEQRWMEVVPVRVG